MEYFTFTCQHCGLPSKKRLATVKYAIENRKQQYHFCSQKCCKAFSDLSVVVECANCGVGVKKAQHDLRKIKNAFCTKSCAATFNNKLKRKSRRSKCEEMLFSLIKQDFPHLPIIANDKTLLCGSEVDIAIPTISLAIEWNGIVHFEPIYGQNKLTDVQRRDTEKIKTAREKKIELIVIPDLVSTAKYVKQAYAVIKKRIEQLTQTLTEFPPA